MIESRLIWALPGPSRFLNEIVETLRRGESAVVVLPPHVPDGLRLAAAERARDMGMQWRDLDPGHQPPMDFLAAKTGQREARTVEKLAAAIGPTAFWIEVEMAAAASWNDFLERFAPAVEALDPMRRPAVALAVPAPAAPSSGTLRMLPWRGIVARLDAIVLASSIVERRRDHVMSSRLTAAMAADLAGFDLRLVKRLSEMPSRDLWRPEAIVEAALLGGSLLPNWNDGGLDEVDGKATVALAALRGGALADAVRRRLWAAHVSVLFPWLETQRQDLVELYGGMVKLPFQTQYGSVTNAMDLELGHLLHHLRQSAIPTFDLQYLNLLVQVRHALAHLNPLDLALLQQLDRGHARRRQGKALVGER